jgi:hypothetical protein
LAAESISKSGDAKKYSTSSSTSGDAINENPQDAANDGVLNQDEAQTVDQQGSTLFGDDTAGLDDINVAIPIAQPINVDENLEEENDEDNRLDDVIECLTLPPGQIADCIAELGGEED